MCNELEQKLKVRYGIGNLIVNIIAGENNKFP